MSEWKAKRFWKAATVEDGPDGYQVRLDARPLMTPLKSPLIVPTQAMAVAMATEWDAQATDIDPRTMPVTRSANSAIDKVAPQRQAVADMLAAYAETDLLCHRAEMPVELAALQADGWDPLLDWAGRHFQAPLVVTTGVMPVEQPTASLAALAHAVTETPVFTLTALHDLIMLSGSLVLGLAVARREIPADRAWLLSRIDEDWQTAQWGHDDEAAAVAIRKRDAFLHADRFVALAAGF